jgi:hypothetical protein
VRCHRCLLLITLLCFSLPAHADVVTFSSLEAFTAAAPGLPVETFESGLVDPGGITTCPPPLSSSTASACFPASGLLPGVVYDGNPPLAVQGTGGVTGNTSKVLSSNRAALRLQFVDGVTAVGMDVYGLGTTAVISVFGPGGSLFDFSGPVVNGGFFFGIVSNTETIQQVLLYTFDMRAPPIGALGPGTIDNLRFEAATVPETSSLTLLLMGGLAFIFCMKKKAMPPADLSEARSMLRRRLPQGVIRLPGIV